MDTGDTVTEQKQETSLKSESDNGAGPTIMEGSGDAPETVPPLMAGRGQDITPNEDGGVMKAIIKEGIEGAVPMKGDHVEVHYIGTLLDGTKFDSSRDRGEKFSFTLGEGQVIKAWDIGVATMQMGEIAVLTCKPEYAYGKKAQGKIPPNSTLVFEVELFSSEGEDLTEDHNKGILRRIVESGDGWQNPNDEGTVTVHVTGTYEDNTFDDREVTFIMGEGNAQSIPQGIEIALQKMKKGEKSQLTLKPEYAFGASGNEEFKVPPNSTVTYEVHLKEFEKAKESWEMDVNEKLEQGEVVKNKGTEYFKSGDYSKAIKQYKKIVDFLGNETDVESDKKEKSEKLLLAAHLNLAMCYLKTLDNLEAIAACEKALEMDMKNEKGYFRRGAARVNQSEFELAEKDFKKVLELAPNNKAARNQLTLVSQKIKAQKEKEKKIYGNMFAKFAEQDARAAALKKADDSKKLDKVFEKVGDGDQADDEMDDLESEEEEEEEEEENEEAGEEGKKSENVESTEETAKA
ncbi:peptidyl-prolyl cis-trans isomerase FKBP4-like [Glandiceps talaboti]